VPGVDVSKRRDFQKSHVIISEKKDKKAAKHMTKDLPYPFTSAAQYEASLRGAVGSEWSTRATVQKATMPRVVTKVRPRVSLLPRLADAVADPCPLFRARPSPQMGTIIHPLQKQW
jgi:U3 small nucleolar RNA-associated protein 14